LLECLPLCAALLIISSLVWGPILAPLPFMIGILSFHVYWLWRGMINGASAFRGYILLKRYKNTDWQAKFHEARVAGKAPFAWNEIRHIVIIPNYTEGIEKLRAGLDSLAASPLAQQIVAVLAMEDREGAPAREKAATLIEEYSPKVGRIFATFHPYGLPGEVVGKSSNENWAARRATERLIDVEGGDISAYTITSCDVDTVFRSDYFPALTYKFATNPHRYRRFWQGPIFYYNNIWHVPAPARLQHALSGMTHLGRLSRTFFRMVFPQSTYSLSLQMAHDVGFWDPDIVPEDWHMFLKCYYALGGNVDTETIYSPIYMDGIRSKTYFRTFANYYDQNRRHAWGCSDIPYASLQFIDHPEIPFFKRFRRLWALVESHILWSTQWWLITAGRTIPIALVALGLAELPGWYSFIDKWLLVPTGGTLLLMIILDSMSRPPRPKKEWPFWLFPVQFAQWFLMAFITFWTSAMPGLDAQTRLAIGKRLEYRVTEKA
jgi:Glycosyl transferase family group 2